MKVKLSSPSPPASTSPAGPRPGAGTAPPPRRPTAQRGAGTEGCPPPTKTNNGIQRHTEETEDKREQEDGWTPLYEFNKVLFKARSTQSSYKVLAAHAKSNKLTAMDVQTANVSLACLSGMKTLSNSLLTLE